MAEMKEVELPSGAMLKIGQIPFMDAKGLYQVLLRELKEVSVSLSDIRDDLPNLYKNLFCVGFSSVALEQALWKCFPRCIYSKNGKDFKIDRETFEPVENRDDYMRVCTEVAKEVVAPFMKSLYADYLQFTEVSKSFRA